MNIPSLSSLTTTNAQIQAHFDAGDRFGFVCMSMRVGCASLFTHLEYEHYNPNDPALNDRFQVFIIRHQGLDFQLISIPLEDRHLAEKMAEKYGCRFADGLPTVFGGDGDPMFPIRHKHIWSVENVKTHPCYSPGYDSNKALHEEHVEVGKFLDAKHAEYEAQNKPKN